MWQEAKMLPMPDKSHVQHLIWRKMCRGEYMKHQCSSECWHFRINMEFRTDLLRGSCQFHHVLILSLSKQCVWSSVLVHLLLSKVHIRKPARPSEGNKHNNNQVFHWQEITSLTQSMTSLFQDHFPIREKQNNKNIMFLEVENFTATKMWTTETKICIWCFWPRISNTRLQLETTGKKD